MLFRRLAKLVAVLTVGVTALAVAPLTGAPATGAQESSSPSGPPESSPRVAEPFELELIEGELLIRDADEAYALENLTSISGTNNTDNGAITGGSFTTPQVNLRQDITSPIPASVFIDADFALVNPNSGIGSITSDGFMTFQASVRVNLHVDVQPPGGGDTIIAADCRTSPVNLEFVTTSPYVPAPDGDKEITLRDPNFSIPPMVEEPACDSLISGEINNQLAGPGHSLALTLGGDITLPPPPPCPTTTTLVASPEGEAELGTPVDLTATVTPDALDEKCIEAATNGDVLTGFVDFFDGPSRIGSAPVAPDGTANLPTSTIPAGTRSLTARYQGANPFGESPASAPLSYRITPNPTISATLPEYVQIDAAPTEFEVSATNTGFGGEITNARLDITFARRAGLSADLGSERLMLEYLDANDAWVTVPLTETNPTTFNLALFGSIGPATGFSLAVGEEVTTRLRVRVLTTGSTAGTACAPEQETCPGPVEVTVELVEVDDVSGSPTAGPAPAPGALATSAGTFTVTEATRRTSAVVFGVAFVGGPISPYKVRQGGAAALPRLTVGPLLSNTLRPTGFVEFELDGKPLAVRRIINSNAAPDAPGIMRVPLGSAVTEVMFDTPLDIAVGTHQVKVKYLGDALFLPSENSTTLTVVASVGVTYDCLAPASTNIRFRAHVESGLALPLPAVRPAGSTLPLGGLSLRMLFSRANLAQANARNQIAPANGTRLVGPTLSIDLGFGPDGSGTAVGIAHQNGTTLPQPTVAVPDPPVDETFTFQSPSGSVVLNGAPGDVVPVTLDVIKVTGTDPANQPHPITCTPIGAPVELGSVTLSGNTLTVEPGGRAGEGDAVTFTSAVEPYTSGQVEFRDNGVTIGVVPVVDGLASTVIDNLSIGTRNLTAVFSGGFLAPAIVSNEVELDIVSCPGSFAEEGNGAVVRLVYMQLLGDCPDPTGYAYWKGRLDSGTSQQRFADTISDTLAARKEVANDAYQAMLGRNGDPGGLAYWAEFLLTHPYREALARMGDSDEYWTKAGGTNEGFITRTYERLLDRAPDTGGFEYWLERLESGDDRSKILNEFANETEPARKVVTQSFDEILNRDPTTEERDEHVALYKGDGNRSALYSRLIGLLEFFDLAQTFPSF